MNASAVGKLTPTAPYVHRRAVDRMPTVLRLYEYCASIAAGRPSEWTVAKLRHRGRTVSWLNYPDFDKDPHPRIRSSYQVDLQSLETSHTSYADSVNRPLFHRKHEFLAPDDRDVDRYKRLTASEVRAGLSNHRTSSAQRTAGRQNSSAVGASSGGTAWCGARPREVKPCPAEAS
ncbi:hypothetical protein GCM10023347_38520 [Streptomyces chumphonensis]